VAKVFGSNGNDTINGDRHGSTLADLGGHDTLNGNNGRDSLYGGTGDGDDTIFGNGSQDSLYGGTGNDHFIIVNDRSNS
jgi:Ca2+-binding RTX toxin-like protein